MKKPFLVLISMIGFTLSLSVNAHTAHNYQVVEVTNGGTIVGKVTFKGEDPPPRMFSVTKDMDVCGTGTRKIDYVKIQDGGLSDVVVYLENVKAGKPFSNIKLEEKPQVEQKECEMGSLLKVMLEGQDLEIINADSVTHKMHAYEMITDKAKKTMFTVNQPPTPKNVVTKDVELRRGMSMMMQCDQHEFMQSFVFVAKNPYYAVVTEDGTFKIEDIPPDKYTVKAWHGTLKDQKTKLTVEAGNTVTVEFEFSK